MQIIARPIRSRGKRSDWIQIAKEIARTMDDVVKPRMLDYPERIVARWSAKNRPTFKATKHISNKEIFIRVVPTGPNADRWKQISRGTGLYGPKGKKYRIPKEGPGPPLAFPSVYSPKTTVRGPGFKGPGTSSGPMVFASHVMHSGIKARHFEEAWARWSKTWFKREIENAIRRGIRKSTGR